MVRSEGEMIRGSIPTSGRLAIILYVLDFIYCPPATCARPR